MKRHKRALVLGFGNTLRGDDALGRIAAERVQAATDPAEVTVISQSAPTPELAAVIAQASLVIFLDAAIDGPADRIVVRELTSSKSPHPMAHRLDPASLLGLAGHLFGHEPQAFALTFRCSCTDFRDRELTPAASIACDQLVQTALDLIDQQMTDGAREFSGIPVE